MNLKLAPKKMGKEKLLEKSKRFLHFSRKIAKYFKSIEVDLLQFNSELNLEEHISIAIYSGLKVGLMASVFLISFGIILEKALLWKLGILMAPMAFVMMFYTHLMGPRIAIKRRARLIDEDLPYALRHLLIEVKSGVPLYNSLVAISTGYESCSEEISHIIKDINAGKSNAQAIEESILKNPSIAYRRSFWHILNALQTGTSLEQAMEATVDEIIKDQLISIKKYGQELNPWTLLYMMFGVILPSLGIAFMMILSTFSGFAVSGSILYSLLVVLAMFQILFINVIRTKRPMVKI